MRGCRGRIVRRDRTDAHPLQRRRARSRPADGRADGGGADPLFAEREGASARELADAGGRAAGAVQRETRRLSL